MKRCRSTLTLDPAYSLLAFPEEILTHILASVRWQDVDTVLALSESSKEVRRKLFAILLPLVSEKLPLLRERDRGTAAAVVVDLTRKESEEEAELRKKRMEEARWHLLPLNQFLTRNSFVRTPRSLELARFYSLWKYAKLEFTYLYTSHRCAGTPEMLRVYVFTAEKPETHTPLKHVFLIGHDGEIETRSLAEMHIRVVKDMPATEKELRSAALSAIEGEKNADLKKLKECYWKSGKCDGSAGGKRAKFYFLTKDQREIGEPKGSDEFGEVLLLQEDDSWSHIYSQENMHFLKSCFRYTEGKKSLKISIALLRLQDANLQRIQHWFQ
jgi:hypothetical protein